MTHWLLANENSGHGVIICFVNIFNVHHEYATSVLTKEQGNLSPLPPSDDYKGIAENNVSIFSKELQSHTEIDNLRITAFEWSVQW